MMEKAWQLKHSQPLCQELEVTAPHSLEENQRTGPNDRLDYNSRKPALSGLYLPASPYDLKVPYLQKQPSAGDQVVKQMTQWR